MKIGVCVSFNDVEGLEERLARTKEKGIYSCQLIAWNPEIWTDENAVYVRDLLARSGVEVSAFWCGWTGPKVWDFYEGQATLGLVPEAYRKTRVKELCAGADFAKKLGITDVVTHMGFIPENPLDPTFTAFCDAVRIVAEHLKKNGQYLLFEAGQETPVTMLRCFETVGTDNLGVNLDTANVILYGKADPVAALEVFGKYVRNLHAKDGFYPVNGHDLGREVRIGDGRVNFRGVFEKLHELSFDSYVTIEREISGSEQDRDILYAKKYLEDLISEIYGGDHRC